MIQIQGGIQLLHGALQGCQFVNTGSQALICLFVELRIVDGDSSLNSKVVEEFQILVIKGYTIQLVDDFEHTNCPPAADQRHTHHRSRLETGCEIRCIEPTGISLDIVDYLPFSSLNRSACDTLAWW